MNICHFNIGFILKFKGVILNSIVNNHLGGLCIKFPTCPPSKDLAMFVEKKVRRELNEA